MTTVGSGICHPTPTPTSMFDTRHLVQNASHVLNYVFREYIKVKSRRRLFVCWSVCLNQSFYEKVCSFWTVFVEGSGWWMDVGRMTALCMTNLCLLDTYRPVEWLIQATFLTLDNWQSYKSTYIKSVNISNSAINYEPNIMLFIPLSLFQLFQIEFHTIPRKSKTWTNTVHILCWTFKRHTHILFKLVKR